MKNKAYTICLNCGKVQIRTDIEKEIKDKYIVLDKKINCPICSANTKVAVTNNIKILKKELLVSHNNKMDNHLLELIG